MSERASGTERLSGRDKKIRGPLIVHRIAFSTSEWLKPSSSESFRYLKEN